MCYCALNSRELDLKNSRELDLLGVTFLKIEIHSWSHISSLNDSKLRTLSRAGLSFRRTYTVWVYGLTKGLLKFIKDNAKFCTCEWAKPLLAADSLWSSSSEMGLTDFVDSKPNSIQFGMLQNKSKVKLYVSFFHIIHFYLHIWNYFPGDFFAVLNAIVSKSFSNNNLCDTSEKWRWIYCCIFQLRNRTAKYLKVSTDLGYPFHKDKDLFFFRVHK